MGKRKRQVIIAILFSLFIGGFIFSSANAMDKRIRHGGAGFKAGLINKTTFLIDNIEYESKFGLTAGVFFDVALIRKTKLSFAFDFHDINVMNDRQWMIDVSVGLKPTIYNERGRTAIKPGIAGGFGYMFDVGKIESTTYITIKYLTEFMFLVDEKYSYLIEFSVMDTFNGGNNDIDVSFNPSVSLRLGVMY